MVEVVEKAVEKLKPVKVPNPEIARLGLGEIVIPPLDKTQKELLDTPVDDIPEESLFIPVPLVARLASSNVTVVQDLAKR